MSTATDNHQLNLKVAEDEVKLVTRLQNPNQMPVCPRFHIVPPCGWMRGPNGIAFFDGAYHAFFNFNPFLLECGAQHWGHVVSTDLVRWNHASIALAPSESYDFVGCYGGSALAIGDVLALFYMGHAKSTVSIVGDVRPAVSVCLATSSDGHHFEKQGVVIEKPHEVIDFSDPKVWKGERGLYMTIAASVVEEEGGGILPQVWMYSSENLTEWRFDRVLVEMDKFVPSLAYESPDLFQLDGEAVLVATQQRITKEGKREITVPYTGAYRGEYSEGGSLRVVKPFTELDLGTDFHFPQTVLTPDGRRVLFAWANDPDAPQPTIGCGFVGNCTLPRELGIGGGKLIQRPIDELKSLRGKCQPIKPCTIAHDRVTITKSARMYEFILEFDARTTDAEIFAVSIVEGFVVEFLRLDKNRLEVRVRRNYPELGIMEEKFFIIDDLPVLRLHGFYDHSIIELFFNDYSITTSSRCYPTVCNCALEIYAISGSVILTDGYFWELSTAAKIEHKFDETEPLLNWPPAYDNR